MQKFCSSANTVYSDVDSQNYPTDLRAALGVKDLEDYCEKLESSGAQYRFINNFNSPMDLGNLYRSFLRETPDILLVDGKPGLVKQIQDYVENLMVLGQGLTPQRALILNGLLPPQFCQGFKRLHNKLKFPQDHHVDTNSMAGWYNITGNLILAADKSQLGITIYFRYQPIFPREFLHSKGLPSDAYLVQSVYLTVSTGSTFSHNSGGLVMSNSDAATHSIALQSQVFFSVGNSYLNSKDSNLENLVIGAVDLDSGTGLPISVRLVLKSEKPMIAHYNYYSQGYSYPRYTVADLGLQYNGKTAVATDFLMDQSFFRVDHRWVFGGMTNMHTYVENPLLRAISNFYKKTPEGLVCITAHLDDQRDLEVTAWYEVTADRAALSKQLYIKYCLVNAKGMVGDGDETAAVTLNEKACVVVIGIETFVFQYSGNLVTTIDRLGNSKSIDCCFITQNDEKGPVIGKGFVKIIGTRPAAETKLDPLSILQGALLDNRVAVDNMVREPIGLGLKIQSGLFIALVMLLMIFIFIFLPIYLLVLLYKFLQNRNQ